MGSSPMAVKRDSPGGDAQSASHQVEGRPAGAEARQCVGRGGGCVFGEQADLQRGTGQHEGHHQKDRASDEMRMASTALCRSAVRVPIPKVSSGAGATSPGSAARCRPR